MLHIPSLQGCSMPSRLAAPLLAFLIQTTGTLPGGITPVHPTADPEARPAARSAAPATGEARAARAFNAAKAQGAPELYAFLKPFPKGADLHMHLSGAVYAETFIREAAQQGLCVAPVDAGKPAVPEGQNALHLVQPQADKACASGEVPAADALKRQPLYDDLINSFSMRAFVPTEGISGHDQFFATFDRYGGLKTFTGEWLDEVATRAAAQNEQYLEIMNTPTFTHAATLGYKLGWPAFSDSGDAKGVLAKMREQLLAQGLRDEVSVDRKEFADAMSKRHDVEHCNVPTKVTVSQDGDPCHVEIRFLYQVLRGFPPQQVFAQTLLGFEVAQAELDSGDPLVVGINFVMPEDGRVSMQDYQLQMYMLDYLHSVYPKVHISLHAGELAFGMVPPDGLRFHIREAVELGHAERIGHGVDVLYEDNPNQLLKEMADRHVMVEVNPTSNDIILGVRSTDHPLAAYRGAHVPFALSTDDEGVSRIDLTHEYVKAAMDQNLTYADLKRSARTSLEHSFLPGQSLWASPDDFSHPAAACTSSITATSQPAAACQAFLKANKRAGLQWELERRLAAFEASLP
jgi:adenosine deaminase